MRKLLGPVLVLVSVTLLSGCRSPGTNSPADKSEVRQSNHTIQELCDFPKKFYTDQFRVDKLQVEVIATKPVTEKIGAGNGCDYHPADSDYEYLGYISLDAPSATWSPSSTPSPTATFPARVLVVDGISIIATPSPAKTVPPGTTTSAQYVLLTATIDGWRGEFEFIGRDDRTTETGARVLVGMIRSLKN